MATSFQKLKLVDEQELGHLIEKQIRQYNPTLKVLANIYQEMDTAMGREDLLPEEKLALYKNAQQRFAKIKQSFSTSAPIIPQATTQHPEPNPLIAPIAAQQANNPNVGVATEIPDATVKTKGPTATSSTLSAPLPESGEGVFEDALGSPQHKPVVDFNVDSKFNNKLTQLNALLSKNSSLLSFDPDNGEMICNGQQIKGSSYVHLVRSLYHTSKTHNLNGQDKFISALKELFHGNSQLAPADLIEKREYLTHFSSRPSASASTSTKTTIPSPTQHSLRSQLGKGRRFVSHPPGKKIKILKCYN